MTELALGEDLAPKTREYLESAHGSTETLVKLVGDLLDFSKLAAGDFKLECQPFRLRALVHEIASTPAASAKGLRIMEEIDPNLPDPVRGDPARLAQLLANLVGNAVKFSDQGVIKVRGAVHRIAGDQDPIAIRSVRSGDRHRGDGPGPDFRPIRASRRHEHATTRRGRTGADDRSAAGLLDGRATSE